MYGFTLSLKHTHFVQHQVIEQTHTHAYKEVTLFDPEPEPETGSSRKPFKEEAGWILTLRVVASGAFLWGARVTRGAFPDVSSNFQDSQ